MSLLTDNPITRFFGGTLDKLRLLSLLTDDFFEYFFPPETTSRVQKLLYLIGIYYITVKTAKFIYSLRHWKWVLHHYQYARNFNPNEFAERYGKGCWAVVTGFSTGIGFAYACELAKLGFNLVLVDWKHEIAEASERWVKQRNSAIKTKVVILDLTSDPKTIHQVLESATADLDVGFLVNNAGMTSPGLFETIDRKVIINTLKLNLIAGVECTRVFLPRMRKRYPRSAIINIASGIAQFPSPNVGVYSATKQFMRMFTYGLYQENTDKIDVLCVKPMGVLTAMMQHRKNVPFMVQPEAVAKESLYELGSVRSTFGAVQHKFLTTTFREINSEKLCALYAKDFVRKP